MAAYGLYTHIASNKFRSMLLLAGLFLLIYVLVYAGALIAEVLIDSGGSVNYYLAAATRDLVKAFPYATIAAALWIVIAYFFHQSIIDAVTGGEDAPSRSRSRATTTPPRSNPSRAPRQASAASCATSPRWARGRSRSSTGCASASPTATSRVRSVASATTATASACPTVGGEAVFDDAYADNCLVNAMCVGLLPAERLTAREGEGRRGAGRPLRRDDGPGRHRRRLGAREPGARRRVGREAAVRAGRRSVHGQEADRGLGRARRARARRVAPGLRRGGARLVAVGDGRATTASMSTSTACRCARREWSRGR